MTVRRWKTGTAWNLVVFAALSTVVASASPAAAVTSTTTVQASPASVTTGQQFTLNAVVTCPNDPSGAPQGMVFFDGSTQLGGTVLVAANGTASTTATLSTVGTHTIAAIYGGNGVGDGDCGASNGETTVVVSEAPTPPAPPSGGICLLTCGGLVNFKVGDIHNEINVYGVSRRSSAYRP